MKAVAFAGPGKMEVRDIAEPQPGDGEVVVDVAFCGVCGSDLHEYASEAPSPRSAGVFQPVMGHEFTGLVSAVGPGVDSPARPAIPSLPIREGRAGTATIAARAAPTSAPSRSAPATAVREPTPNASW